jgi:amino acid transporter
MSTSVRSGTRPTHDEALEKNGQASWLLFTGTVVAATGGPLYLSASLLPNLLTDTSRSSGLVAVVGAAMFLPTLVVWLRYSEDIRSAGGLFAFVEAAAGRKIALVQAGLWFLSYGLYLSYTTAYICYDLLPAAFPAITPYREWLQLALPLVLVTMVLAPIRWSMIALTAVAAAQVALVALMASLAMRSSGAWTSSFLGRGELVSVTSASANMSLLFICSGLPLFLATEVRGDSRTVRSGLVTGWGTTAVLSVMAAVPLSAVSQRLLSSELAGVGIADRSTVPAFADLIGIGTAVSVAGVMAVEFLAMTRLAHAVTKQPVRKISRVLAGGFVAVSAMSLTNPEQVYQDLLMPSLVALWLAQLIVVAVYPRFAAMRSGLRLSDMAVAAGGVALMAYGLYTAVGGSVST